jgi:mannose/fructose/N-acetylgalactosamine-specific phosphotransferase system component IIB
MNTSNSSVVNTSWTKNLIANTLITTAAIAVTGKTHTNTLQANTSANTETLSVTQRALIDQVQANTSVNTQILSVSTTAFANRLEANSIVYTPLLNVTGNTFTNRLQSNISVNTATMSVTQKIDANNASVFVNNLQTVGQLSVGGNFVINGTTIYNSNVFTLNAGSNEGLISSIDINRGVTGANASLRWNETNKNFDTLLNKVKTYPKYKNSARIKKLLSIDYDLNNQEHKNNLYAELKMECDIIEKAK